MAESIVVRVKRIISGSVYDTVEAMERAGGTSVMREAIREVDRVVDEVKSERDKATAARLQAVRLQSLYKERLSTLQEKAEFAIDAGREDLAEAALHRQVEFEGQIVALGKAENDAADKERQFEENLASLTMRKEQMEEELKSYEIAQQGAGIGADVGESSQRKKESRVERAEAAFDRAISGAGGNLGQTKTDMAHAVKVAEIDALQKNSVIAERMEALRNRKKAG